MSDDNDAMRQVFALKEAINTATRKLFEYAIKNSDSVNKVSDKLEEVVLKTLDLTSPNASLEVESKHTQGEITLAVANLVAIIASYDLLGAKDKVSMNAYQLGQVNVGIICNIAGIHIKDWEQEAARVASRTTDDKLAALFGLEKPNAE